MLGESRMRIMNLPYIAYIDTGKNYWDKDMDSFCFWHYLPNHTYRGAEKVFVS